MAHFTQVLADIYKDSTPEEVRLRWQPYLEHDPQYVQDFISATEKIIAHPPEDLEDILSVHGWISHCKYSDTPEERPYTRQEYLEWLQEEISWLKQAATA